LYLAVHVNELALAFTQAIDELASVGAAVRVRKLTLTVWLTVLEFTYVVPAIRHNLNNLFLSLAVTVTQLRTYNSSAFAILFQFCEQITVFFVYYDLSARSPVLEVAQD
jgi:hypothetical protein